MPTMRVVEMATALGAVVARVAEREDPTVGSDLPVAAAIGSRRHADDGVVEVSTALGAKEARVAEREHPTVGRDLPVAAAIGSGRHADDGVVEGRPPSEPKKPASPNAKIPPSDATSQ